MCAAKRCLRICAACGPTSSIRCSPRWRRCQGVGPQVAKLLKRLDITRVVDLLYHLPTGVDRAGAGAGRQRRLLGRNVILDLTPFETREPRSGRGPMRVFASDGDGNTISLIYFNNPGWAKKSLPMGETRIVSGKLEAYGDEWQIIHPGSVASRARAPSRRSASRSIR